MSPRSFAKFVQVISYLIFDHDDWQLDQDTEIDISEMTSEFNPDDEYSTFPDQDLLIHHDSIGCEQMRFGESSDEIQQYKNSLTRVKSQVDTDRRVVTTEQVEVDNARARIGRLSEQISHEGNENLVYEYQNERSFADTDLLSHQRKLEQARADLAIHQQAEWEIEDKMKDLLS